MTNQLNEYKDYPKWIDTLSAEQRHEWYLLAKERIKEMDPAADITHRLAQAILTYEQNAK